MGRRRAALEDLDLRPACHNRAVIPLGRIAIQGFKSLRDAAFDLGQVNVFVGANGSGKSNALEAIGVLGAAVFRAVEPEALRYRGVRPGLPALYKSSFRSGIRRSITLECSAGTAHYRVGLDNPVSSSSEPWKILTETLTCANRHVLTRSPRACWQYDEAGERSEKALPSATETFAKTALQRHPTARDAQELVQALIDYAIYSPTTDVLRGLKDDVSRPPLGLSGSGLALAIKDLLDKERARLGPYELDDIWELIDWADNMAVVPAQHAGLSPAVAVGPTTLRFRDRHMGGRRNTLSAYDASEGALYVLFLLALAAHPRAPRTFAVDNFDHALHPRLAARLMRAVSVQLLGDGERQMLLTTHNPLVLDGLDLRDPRVRLFAVERQADGSSAVRRVELGPALLEQVESGLSLSRLWVMGRLGGVPADL